MRIRLIAPIVAVVLSLGGVDVASAQSYVANPNTVEFIASPDHAITLQDGTILVAKYEFRVFLDGATSPVQVNDLGKPTPGANGLIAASIVGVIASMPVDPTNTYRARVAAVSATGAAGESAPSNPFGVVSLTPRAPASAVVKRL